MAITPFKIIQSSAEFLDLGWPNYIAHEENRANYRHSQCDFYRAACNADAVLRGEFCLSVRLSVCPSVTRVIPDKTEERSVQILNHTKEHLA